MPGLGPGVRPCVGHTVSGPVRHARALPQPEGTDRRCNLGLDLWHANYFVAYRRETAKYLYESYSPTSVRYKPGTLPAFERIAAEYTAGLKTDREKAVALLTKAIPDKVPHPAIAPMAPMCDKNRGLDDDGLLASRTCWCNEQARVFVRLCQVAGIPAD